MGDSLTLFRLATAQWFRDTLGSPTPVQEASWHAIAKGGHVLVSAPTGTGKTLSAFLVFLDEMMAQAAEGSLQPALQLIYVSPLKSLAADIRENLRRPLAGIGGEDVITAAVRTGDTTQSERRRMIRKPPHILITTPESLYLMLTSKTGQDILCTARAVIVDELHALIDTKRGAHLMLSLARLDRLCEKPLQRIGLSATISPLEEAAGYLAPEPVFVAAPSMEKKVSLQILGSYVDNRKRKKDPVWQELSELVYRYCQGKRSVIAFVEGRRYAEKLAYYVNQLGGEEFARVHHGSLSKEQRQETEAALREGRLRLLCATSSMELGIDVGEIDQVLQVGCPRTISSAMQRLGRAGHNPSRTSSMYLFPRTAAECLLCGMTAQLAREGFVEKMNPPEGCLDVLAQHLVSMAAFRGYTVDEVMEILPRALPFQGLTKEDVKAALAMLAGDYEHKRDVPVRPRILYDRIHERVEGDGYSRMLAVSAGGTIPDKGLFAVRTAEGVKIGEADEEFVYESRKGDRFLLGAFAWQIVDIGRDTVTVTQTGTEGAKLPFWHGEIKGRSKRTGEAFGKILHRLQEAQEDGKLEDALAGLGLDTSAVELAAGYVSRQIAATGALPDDRTIIVEHFKDQSGNTQMMIHSVFGRQINAPLSLLAVRQAQEEMETNVSGVDEEDGFLLYTYGDKMLPERLLYRIEPEKCEVVLSALLPATPLFNMAFRYNCGRALMMGVRNQGRQPLWMQRLKSAEMLDQALLEKDHPLIVETRRECLHQLWDVRGVTEILHKIRSGEIVVREIYTETPSPMSLPLQWMQEAAVMYDYAPTPDGVRGAVEEALEQEEELLPPGDAELHDVQTRKKLPEDESQLHTLLMTEGDLTAGELDIPVAWLENLAKEGRALYLEQGLWIAAEQQEEYRTALEDMGQEEMLHIVRRMLRYRGASDVEQIALRYGLPEETAQTVLEELCRRGEAVRQEEAERKQTLADKECGQASKDAECGQTGTVRYFHAQLYKRAAVRTVQNRRAQIATVPPESYAALLLSRIRRQAPPEECVRTALAQLSGMAYPAAAWEEYLLPARVKNYRENLLDGILAQGEYFWHMEKEGRIKIDPCSQIDWEIQPQIPFDTLSDKERLIVDTLKKRGASFMQGLNSLLNGESPYDTLMSLVEKGIVCADSFVPVRQWINKEKIEKAAARRRVGAHVQALHAGRFDLVRPLLTETVQGQMDRCFDRYMILCRETAAACGVNWQEALKLLRVQEYTGQVRRGYFVRGLSGAQFIRQKDFEGVTAELRSPRKETLWLNAADPVQVWGKLLPHGEGRSFINVPGTVVAFRGGMPTALFERQGRTLRIFTEEGLEEVMALFVEEYKRGRVYAGRKRIVVADYPPEAVSVMAKSGFRREMEDYVLYR